MAIIQTIFQKKFFVEYDGKIFKAIEMINGERFLRVRIAVNTADEADPDIAILPGDLMIPGLLRVVHAQDIRQVELYDTAQEMIDVLAGFKLKPPSYLIDQLISDFGTIKRRQKFDQQLTEHLGEKAIKRLCAALWMIDDPNIAGRFARTPQSVKAEVEEQQQS